MLGSKSSSFTYLLYSKTAGVVMINESVIFFMNHYKINELDVVTLLSHVTFSNSFLNPISGLVAFLRPLEWETINTSLSLNSGDKMMKFLTKTYQEGPVFFSFLFFLRTAALHSCIMLSTSIQVK